MANVQISFRDKDLFGRIAQLNVGTFDVDVNLAVLRDGFEILEAILQILVDQQCVAGEIFARRVFLYGTFRFG